MCEVVYGLVIAMGIQKHHRNSLVEGGMNIPQRSYNQTLSHPRHRLGMGVMVKSLGYFGKLRDDRSFMVD